MAETRPATDAIVGCTIDDKILVQSVIGSGGMGVVYKAHHNGLDRDVAVKVLNRVAAADQNHLLRFKAEANSLRSLEHPNILKIYSFGVLHDGTPDAAPYMVLEYMDGGSLSDRLQEGATFSIDECLSMLGELAAALAEAHRHGLVHRDVKPSNIMFDKRVLKIVDFGIVKSVHGSGAQKLTQTGALLGTPLYMSPEQLSGQSPTPPADIYSLGCVLFEMIYGETYTAGENLVELAMSKMNARNHFPKKSAKGEAVPAGLQRLLRGMLEVDPATRIQDGSALQTLVAEVRKAPDVVPAELNYQPVRTKGPAQGKRRHLLSVVILVAIFSGVAVYFSFFPIDQQSGAATQMIDQLSAMTSKMDMAEGADYPVWDQCEKLCKQAYAMNNKKVTSHTDALIAKMAIRLASKSFFLSDSQFWIGREYIKLPPTSAKDSVDKVGIASFIVSGAYQAAAIELLHKNLPKMQHYLSISEATLNEIPALLKQVPAKQPIDDHAGLPHAVKTITPVSFQCYARANQKTNDAERVAGVEDAREIVRKGIWICQTYPNALYNQKSLNVAGHEVFDLVNHYIELLCDHGNAQTRKEGLEFLQSIDDPKRPAKPFWDEKLKNYWFARPYWRMFIALEIEPREQILGQKLLVDLRRQSLTKKDLNDRLIALLLYRGLFDVSHASNLEQAMGFLQDAATMETKKKRPNDRVLGQLYQGLAHAQFQLKNMEESRRMVALSVEHYKKSTDPSAAADLALLEQWSGEHFK